MQTRTRLGHEGAFRGEALSIYTPDRNNLNPTYITDHLTRQKIAGQLQTRLDAALAQAYEEQSHAMRDHLANCRDVCGGYSDQARRRLAASAMDYNLQVMQEKEAEKRKGHTPTSGQINPWRNGAIH